MQGREENRDIWPWDVRGAGVQRQDKWMLEAIQWVQQNGLPDATHLSESGLELGRRFPSCTAASILGLKRGGWTES